MQHSGKTEAQQPVFGWAKKSLKPAVSENGPSAQALSVKS